MIEHNQRAYQVRCEWGENGVRVLGPISDVLVIVDVLSFTTCVDVAVSRGGIIYPYRWKDKRGLEFAEEIGGLLAGPRDGSGYTLSPASLCGMESGTKLVLPSPNGSTLSALAEEYPTTVIAGCLRNARAIGKWILEQGGRIGLVPAAERWPDGSLRPALEDWIGAGAILCELDGQKSPEAQGAVDAFSAVRSRLPDIIHTCSSGRELIERGFSEDVSIATELNASRSVPILHEGRYIRSDGT